jgi:hypothetical protein
LAIQGTGTYVYTFSTDFQCGSSCDVNSVIGLTKFGNLGNWYTCTVYVFSATIYGVSMV